MAENASADDQPMRHGDGVTPNYFEPTSYDRKAFLITDAMPSYEQQRRDRIRKYSILMSFRIPALILAAIAYSSFHSGLVAVLIITASIPIPWIAVLIANDRPPRRPEEVSRYDHIAPPPEELERGATVHSIET